jgi:CBS domain-containing protein
MRIKEVMTSGAECVHSETTIQQAAEKMKKLKVGALPITENDKLIGMITDRDITVRSTSAGSNPQICSIKDVMTPGVVCCYEDQNVSEALQLMHNKQIRRLPVLDRHDHLVGMVSLGDLATETPDKRQLGQTLEAISRPDNSQ